MDMRKSDEALIRANREAFNKALSAAAMALRTDRRIDGALTAMPSIRARLAELAAIVSLGSDTREAVGKIELGKLMHDAQAWDAYVRGKEIAIEAAKNSRAA